MENASWVIREKSTGKVICETFNPRVVAALNVDKYEAVPILQYLVSINGSSTKPALTELESFMLNHISRFGSTGYPVQKVGSHHWSWQYGNGDDSHACPVVFPTKKQAVASFEGHLEILRDKKAGRL
jgi:hypothetical protein